MGCGASSTKEAQPGGVEREEVEQLPKRPLQSVREQSSSQNDLTANGSVQQNGMRLASEPRSTSEAAKPVNPGFYGLLNTGDYKSPAFPPGLEGPWTTLSPQKLESADITDLQLSATSDGASHGSHMGTFDSLSNFQPASGTPQETATTFQRPKSIGQDPGIESVQQRATKASGQTKRNSDPTGSSGNDSQSSQTSSQKCAYRDRKKSWSQVKLSDNDAESTEEGKQRTEEKSRVVRATSKRRECENSIEGKGRSKGPSEQHRKMTWSQVKLSDEEQPVGQPAQPAQPRQRSKTPTRYSSGQRRRRTMQASDLDTESSKESTRQGMMARGLPKPTTHRQINGGQDSDNDTSSVDGMWRRRRRSRPAFNSPLNGKMPQPLLSVEMQTTSDNDTSSVDGWRTRRGRLHSDQNSMHSWPEDQPPCALESKQGNIADSTSLKPQASMRSQQMQQQRDTPRSVNPFEELVDTQMSTLDQLLTTASLSKPTLTTVVHNPLASNGSLTEEQAIDLEEIMNDQCNKQQASAAAKGHSLSKWPHSTQHKRWRTPSAALLASDCPSDAATLGSLINTAENTPLDNWQPSAAHGHVKEWHGEQAADAHAFGAAGLIESEDDTIPEQYNPDGRSYLPRVLRTVDIDLTRDQYDDMGPMCDVTTHTIAVGAMRLLRQKDKGQLFAGKFIQRPEGGILHKWHEREIINHRTVHGHPNIIGFKDIFLTDMHIVIVTDYATCGSLASLLKERKKLSESEAKRLFRQLIQGLKHCHSKDVFHRNLQLECILLDGNPDIPTLKIGGFSRSKSAEADSQPKSHVSRPAFTAPELLLGSNGGEGLASHNGAPLDVWASGLILYHMLYGHNPFQGSHKRSGFSTQMMRRICSAEYSFPDSPQVSAECKQLLERVLVADPGLRITVQGIMQHPWLSALSADALPRPTAIATGEGWASGEGANTGMTAERIATNARVDDEVLEAVARSRRRRSVIH